MSIFFDSPQGKRGLGEGHPVFVIAEIGKNFIQTEEPKTTEEYLENAIALVKAAKDAGADAVKFQTHNFADEQADIDVVSPHFRGSDRYNWVKRNDLSTPVETFWRPLKQACDEIGITFFSAPMSRGAAHKLDQIEPALWKVGSGDVLDFVMLDHLRTSGKPIIISSGMSTLEEVDKSIAFLKEKTDQVVLLHCVSRYPCPPEDLHLKTIEFFKERYGIPVGFSDHSTTIHSSMAAVALGASVIEKHFSFGRELWGSDHKVSLTPQEMVELVSGIRRMSEDEAYRHEILNHEVVQKGMGEKEKMMDEGEAVFRPLFRKTLVAAQDLPAGTIIEACHLHAKRPQAHLSGLASEEYGRMLGRKLKSDRKGGEPLAESDFE